MLNNIKFNFYSWDNLGPLQVLEMTHLVLCMKRLYLYKYCIRLMEEQKYLKWRDPFGAH